MTGPPYVAVVGASEAAPRERADAFEVGRLLAEAGAVLLCGGLGGVMEEAARGACERGGLAVGLLPGPGREDANPHLAVAIATGLGELRNGLLVRAADVLIAIGGGWGTLSELAFARRTGVPVVLLGSWRLAGADLGERVRSPGRAVERALALAAATATGR